jgi:hypothetical protein
MKELAETTAERKEGRGVWTYVYWVVGILLLYVLSGGPLAMWAVSRAGKPPMKLGVVTGFFYGPLYLAYERTPFHRPLGLYFHLWAPQLFDGNGDRQ